MSKSFTTYPPAFEYAQSLANQVAREIGIEKVREFSSTVFTVYMLPAKEHRTGRELRCEVVRPSL